MRFASLGSGSRGNALLVQNAKTAVLVDCGFSVKETQRRLARLQLQGDDLTAIVLTHEHTDHISGVGVLARKYRIPVYATAGTRLGAILGELPEYREVFPDQAFAIDDLELLPFPVPHDAKQPCQYVVGDGANRLGVLTDTGSITPHISEQLAECDALVLECNHDVELLRNSHYPQSLKQRIAGQYGHLSNEQAAELLSNIGGAKLKHLAAAHLSDKNNLPELAQTRLSEVLNCTPEWIEVIEQNQGLSWRDL